MDLLLITLALFPIVLVIMFCYWLIKRSHEMLTASEEYLNNSETSLNTLSNSKYFDLYGDVFAAIEKEGVEEYQVEWLLQSLDMGHKLEDNGSYVLQSLEKGLPYFCETKQEFEMFFTPDKPVLRGSVRGMLALILFYDNTNQSHPAKRKYWQERLLELARSGNYEAQGALCSKWGELVFLEDAVAGFRAKYETALRQRAEAGNCVAQLAIGEFLLPHSSQERMVWFSKSAQKGFSDAWYQLGQAYKAAIKFDSNNQLRKMPLPEEKVQLLKEKAAKTASPPRWPGSCLRPSPPPGSRCS